MILITGGCFQGKTDFACRLAGERKNEIRVADGRNADAEALLKADVITHLEELIRRQMAERKDPAETVGRLRTENPQAIVTLQELGCGIVPIDADDRAWREACGRIGCELAGFSEAVYRVTCGIPQKIR